MRSRSAGEGNPLEIHALWTLQEGGEMTLQALATALKVRPPTASVFVRRLQALGWVVSERDPLNRKAVRIVLTAAGRGLLERTMHEKDAVLRQVFARLSEEDQRILTGILRKVVSPSVLIHG
jgi:DNA-binding MarR family transcriptional regulator